MPDVSVPHPDDVFVGGTWCPGEGGRTTIVPPATEEAVADVALPSIEQATAAVAAADSDGRANWSRLPVAERVSLVAALCSRLEARFEEMGVLWASEAGMAVRYSKNLHRFGARGAWQTAIAAAEDALADQWRDGAAGTVLVRREPAGVVVGVMAYNGPLVTFGTKIVPALLAGCPVIVKGAPESQLILRVVAECAEEVGLPSGALSILVGDVEIGRALTTDPRVDLVSLTGGQRAAHDIVEATSPRFARTHLELGGKSPALLLPDIDVEATMKTLLPGAIAGTGQVCALLTRILVPESRHDEIIDAMRASWSRITVGDPLDPATQVGPLANPAALQRTRSFLDRARAEGARVVTGGGRPEGLDVGWYFAPTIVTDVRRDSHLARTEVFGPITAVLTYTDIDDAIALANDTDFGLAAAVYTKDRELALECAGRIRAGSVGLNTFGPDVTAPWGGRGASGWGREGGPEGIHEFTELKQVSFGAGFGGDR